MAQIVAGWTSKEYNFGSISPSLPTKAIFATEYRVGNSERVVIRATFGSLSVGIYEYLTLLDASRDSAGVLTVTVDRSEDTIDLVSLGVQPASTAAFRVIIKAELYVDNLTTDAYSNDVPFRLFFYKQERSQRPLVTTSPDVELAARGLTGFGDLRPLNGVQARAYFKGTDHLVQNAHTDRFGIARFDLPAGSYDFKFTGPGFAPEDWLMGEKSLVVGASRQLSVFGASKEDIEAAADFNHIQSLVSQIQWVRYVVPESFTADREAFRDEEADPNDVYTDLAFMEFGRLYRANSYIKYILLATDPKLVGVITS